MEHSINEAEQISLLSILNFEFVVLGFVVFKQRGVATALVPLDLLVHDEARIPISPFRAAFSNTNSRSILGSVWAQCDRM